MIPIKQLIWPSLMPKNQQELDQDLRKLAGVVKYIHMDYVDGKFAQNHSLNFNFKLKKGFHYHIHLVAKNPLPWIKKHFSQFDFFIPQFEAIAEKEREKYLSWMKKENKKIAFAILPETSVSQIKSYLKKLDYLLILTVHPGFYGAKFLPHQLQKIKDIKKINHKIKIIIDGGMAPRTIKLAKQAGGDYFVSGSYTTKAEKPKEAIKSLLRAMR